MSYIDLFLDLCAVTQKLDTRKPTERHDQAKENWTICKTTTKARIKSKQRDETPRDAEKIRWKVVEESDVTI